jgi:hypothetical protein
MSLTPAFKTYRDRAKCPAGHKFIIARRTASAGSLVSTFCQACSRMYKLKAGPLPKEKA